MKSKDALVRSGVYALVLCLLVVCSLLMPAKVFAQQLRVINPTGGNTPTSLRIEIYDGTDGYPYGSWAVFRDGKRETFEGTDETYADRGVPSTHRGIEQYVTLNGAAVAPSSGSQLMHRLIASYVSPVYGSGTAGDPWKVQEMGLVDTTDYSGNNPLGLHYSFVINISYIAGTDYLTLDYIFHETKSWLNISPSLFVTEHPVMGAPLSDLTGDDYSACANTYYSQTSTDSTYAAGVIRAAGANCIPAAKAVAPRIHFFKSLYANSSMNVQGQTGIPRCYMFNTVVPKLSNNKTATATTDPTDTKEISLQRNWNFYTIQTTSKQSFSQSYLVSYGTDATSLNGVTTSIPPTLFGSAPVKMGFLRTTDTVLEGNADHSYLNDSIYVTGLNGIIKQDLTLPIDVTAITVGGTAAVNGTDFSLQPGLLIKAMSTPLLATDTLKFPITALIIKGNTLLQDSRYLKLKLSTFSDLMTIDAGKDTLNLKIVDDEPRDLTLTPIVTHMAEGTSTVFTVSLPTGINAGSAITLNVHDSHTVGGAVRGYTIPSTVTIAAGAHSTTFTLAALSDNMLEREDTVVIHVDGVIVGQMGSTLTDATVYISDVTRTVPANTAITVSTSAASFAKGSTGNTITASLPAGIITNVPITITLSVGGATTADPSSYQVPVTLTIDSAQNSVIVPLVFRHDSIVYGPGTRNLVINSAAADGISPAAFTINNKTVTVTDDNWPLVNPVVFANTATPIDEGGGGSQLSFTLPDGLVAGRDFDFTVSTTSSITGYGAHTLAGVPSSAVHITTGNSTVNAGTITAPADNIVGNDETVTFSATSTTVPAAKIGNTAILIKDKTLTAPPLHLTLTPTVPLLSEGSKTPVTVKLDGTYVLAQPLTINFSIIDGNTSASDRSITNATFTLPAGTNSATVADVVLANTDQIIEGQENFQVSATVSDASIVVVNGTVNINDVTRTVAANTTLTVGASPATWTKGDTRTVSISLPAGISTQIPVTISLSRDVASSVAASGYTLPSTITIPAGSTSTNVSVTLPTNNIVYGPSVQHLTLTGAASDTAAPADSWSFTNNLSFDVADNNYPLAHPLVISNNTIDEGGAGATNTITLPDGLVAGRDFGFKISNVNSLTTGTHGVTARPDSAYILTGSSTGDIQLVTAASDNYVGNDEDVTFSATNSTVTVTNGVVHINDKTTGSLGLTLTPTTTSLNEGSVTDVQIAINGGLILLQPLTVTLTPANISTTASDYTLLQTTLTLPAGTNSATIASVIQANTDKVLEATESFKLTGTVTSGPVVTVPDMNFTVNDLTHLNAAYTAITLTPNPNTAAWTKGQSGTLDIKLPTGVTTETTITVGLTPDAASVVQAGGYTIASPITFSTGNGTSVPFSIPTDNIVYGPATHALQLDGAASDAISSAYTINNVALNITDNNYPLVHPLVISAGNIDEGDAGITNTITLPDGLVAGRDLAFTISNTNSLTLGTHGITSPSGSVTILTGSSAANIELVKTPVDNYVGNDEDVTFSATSPDFTTTNGVIHITDKTIAALGLTLTPSASSLNEGSVSDVTMSISNSLILLQPLTVTLTPVNITTTGTDYTLLQTTLTLPAGTNTITIPGVIQANTDKVIEASESFKLTGTVTSGPAATVPDMTFTVNDLTHLNAAYTTVTLTPNPNTAAWTKGQSGSLDVKLPTGVTTEIPISITLTPDAASVVKAGGYTVASPITIASGNGTSVAFSIPTDNVVYGPATHALQLDAAATDAVASAYTINNVALDITDNNYPLAHPLVISAGNIDEGDAGITNTITLPDGLVAGRDLAFTVSNTNSLTLGTHGITSPSGSVTILTGNSAANIELVKTPIDNYVGNDEDVTFSATSPDFTVTNGMIHITDKTTGTLGLTLTPASSSLNEGASSDVTIAINNSLILLQPLTVTLTPVNTTASSTDYSLLQTTLTLPAGTNTATIANVIRANTDLILEGTEAFKLTGTVTSGPVVPVPDMPFTINDQTHLNPANTAITITPNPNTATWSKGQSGSLDIKLPAGVTTETTITVNLTPDAASVVQAGGYTLASPITFSTGNGTSVALSIPADKILYGPATHALQLDGAASDAISSVYTINNVALNILDNNYPLAHPLVISGGTIDEGGAGITNTITLPDNLVAGRDLDFAITNTNSLTLGTHGITSPATPVKILTGSKFGNIELVQAANDNYVGNDEDVTFSGTSPDFTVTDGVIHINDKTSNVLNLQMFASNNLDEGTKSHIGVQINNSLILLQPLTITFTAVSGTANASDYTLLRPSITLPAGVNNQTYADVLLANTDQVLENTESMKLTGVVTSGPAVTVPDVAFTINDITHTIPANTVITFTPSAPGPWTKGDSKKLLVSLPTGVTTEVPIVINTVPDAASVVKAGGYTLPSPITLSSANDTLVSFTIPTDNYVYGPATHHLTLDGSASDPISSVYTLNNIDLDIADNNYPLATGLTITLGSSTINEGGASTTATISLPGSLMAGRNMDFAINTSSSLTLGAHTISWPANAHFNYGDHSITFATPVALADKVLGNDEDITISGTNPDFTVTGNTLHIADETANDPLNGKITLGFVSGGSHVLEGNNTQIVASLAPGVTSVKPVALNLSSDAASVAIASDYSGLSNITIAAGSNSQAFTLNALTDNILEPTELLRIDGSSTTFPGLTVQPLDVNIDDATHLDPANLVLQIITDSTTVHKGNSSAVHVGFVNPNITSSTAFDITLTPNASSSASASDYNALPSPLTMPANVNSTVFTLQTIDDNLIEGPVTLQIDGTATGFTVNNSGVVNIPEKYPMAVYLTKANDGAEPATNGAFTLKLPGTATAISDVIVDLTMANTGGTTNFTLPVTHWVIPAGTNSISIPVVVIDDYVIQGDGTATGALQVASMVAKGVPYNFTIDMSDVNVDIHDDESDATGPKAEARKLVIEKIKDARKPATNGSFRVRFTDPRLSAVKDIQLEYSVAGDATPDKDYVSLPGMVTLPAFDTEAIVQVVPIMNPDVYHDLTASFTLDNVTSSMKSITWMLAADPTADVKIRDDNGVPDSVLQIIGPNKWTDDTTRKIRVHPALSPNGDGIGNDVMYIENINKFPSNEVTVFNRWGATVFHTMNYSNSSNNFAGRYNMNGSGDVPEGTYYYIIYINDKGVRERFTGFVVIRR